MAEFNEQPIHFFGDDLLRPELFRLFFSPMIDLFLLLLLRRSECEEEEQAEMK